MQNEPLGNERVASLKSLLKVRAGQFVKLPRICSAQTAIAVVFSTRVLLRTFSSNFVCDTSDFFAVGKVQTAGLHSVASFRDGGSDEIRKVG